jgi:GT2 family glycosyltransferase
MSKPLVVIPTYLTQEGDAEQTIESVKSVRDTEGDAVDILLVDDGSPDRGLVDEMGKEIAKLSSDLYRKHENSGFAKTVNIGLQRALDEGRDAILMNADVELQTPGWLRQFQSTKDSLDRPAAVVGALLLFPNGTIQHAGVYFSLLTRSFDHMYKFGPGNLPEALKRRVCPVTAAFMFVRRSALEQIGLYDEKFYMGWEDVDYCIRTFLAEQECIYNPNVRAFHHEMMFRGRPSPKIAEWQTKSFLYLTLKWRDQSFADFVPFL